MSTVCQYAESWRTRDWRENIWKSSVASTSVSTLRSESLSPIFFLPPVHFFFNKKIDVYVAHCIQFWIADHLVNRWIILSRVWGFQLIWEKGKKNQRPGYRWDASITSSRKMSWLTCICRWGRQWRHFLCPFSSNLSLHTSFCMLINLLEVLFELTGSSKDSPEDEWSSLRHEHLWGGRWRVLQRPQEPDGFTSFLQGSNNNLPLFY